MTQPNANEQYMLELVNAERAKTGAQPLAFDGDLNESAEGHSRWMIDTDTFSHTGSGGSSPTTRMKAAGYAFTGSWASGENIAWASTRGPAGFQDEVQLLHTNLMNSAGHRANILNDSFREVGIGFEVGPYQNWEGAFATQNFARSGTNAFITGVAFDDKDGDRFYDPGEGLGGLSVKAVSSTGAAFNATTYESGGYDIALPAGTYTVTFASGGATYKTQTVTVGAKNVKVDLVDPDLGGTAPGPTPTPTPPTPTPTPTYNTISGNTANNTLYGTSGADKVVGLAGNDRLYGQGGNDRLEGGTGHDYLSGSSGADLLFGAEGRDTVYGGSGNDSLSGGAEADIFQFRGSWGSDRVTDFEDGLDRIDMRNNGLAFASLTRGVADVDLDGAVDDVLVQANGQSVGLLNLKAAALTSADFLF